MSDFNDSVRKSLQAEDKELLSGLDEPGILDQTLATLRSTPRWANYFAIGYSLVFMAAAVWCAVRFFNADETRAIVGWATGFLASLMIVSIVKVWFWMQMDKYVVLRELKRLELQTARLLEQRRDQ